MRIAHGDQLVTVHTGRFLPTPSVWQINYLCVAVLADGACALLGSLIALIGRFDGRAQVPQLYVATTFGIPVLWVASIALVGGYDGCFIGGGSEEYRRVHNAAVSLTAAVALMFYAARLEAARGYVVIALPTVTFLDLVCRYQLRKKLHRLNTRGKCLRRVAVVGHDDTAAELIRHLQRERYHGLEVVAVCLPDPSVASQIAGVPVYGGFAEVADVVRESAADAVAVASAELCGGPLRQLAWALEKTATDLYLAPALLHAAGPRTTIRPVAGLPLLHVDHPQLTGAKQLFKSLIDRVVSATGLILLAPVLLCVALIIKLDDGGPVLFRQIRVGKNGRTFTVYKFRTMVADAERQRRLLGALNELDGPLFKIRKDPRVTGPGGWLRRWSLDELPRLVNVLIGDMSLVGPRPPLPDEVDHYGSYVRRRRDVKPGLTGLWQINGRAELSWVDAVRFDVRYVENWSFALDLQILWKTIAAVLRGRGAYQPCLSQLSHNTRGGNLR
jgi:exopolysaccharide biosynthesis polyprenyl glycosylphosphotransferase